MAATVFRLDSEDRAIIHPDAIKLSPDLAKLSNNDVLYIVLAYDYKSPFRQFDLEERKTRAKSAAYLKGLRREPEERVKIQQGIEFYKSLQFDPKRETLDIYRSKLVQLNMSLQNVDGSSTSEIKNVTSSINIIQGEISKLERSIDYDDTMIEITGAGKLSEIEIFQLNREEYLKRWKPQATKR